MIDLAEADYFTSLDDLVPAPYNVMPIEQSNGHAPMGVRIEGGPHDGALVFVPPLGGRGLVIEIERPLPDFPWDQSTRVALRAYHDYVSEPCPAGEDHEHVVGIVFDESVFVTLADRLTENIRQLEKEAQKALDFASKTQDGLTHLLGVGVRNLEEATELGFA